MSRVYIMTFGLFMIFLGVQVFFVKAYVMTPQASRFVAERFQDPSQTASALQNNSQYNPFGNASFQNGFGNSFTEPITQTAYSLSTPGQRSIAPPAWLCWPIFFMGTVVFLHGLALRNS